MQSDFGVIGLAVMGQNLALNIESKGFTVSVFNRTGSKTEEFYKRRAQGKRIVPAYTLEEFVASLKRPRKIMLMVKAGPAVDAMIDALLPLLEPGDIIIDGGNSHFADTDRRVKKVEEAGLHYLGTGVSGGEYGALHGPSIMPGGSREAYDTVAPILTVTAAQTKDGPCCTYLGPASAGHYVKMVHNGIEYGIMQIIAEAYDYMKRRLGMPVPEMQEAVAEWNAAELESYLFEITADILSRTDEKTGNPLVEMILDRAEQKGTGKWTSQSALDLGIPVPTITAAVDARALSSFKDLRVAAAERIREPRQPEKEDKAGLLAALRSGVYLAVIASYAQGMHLLQAASEEHGYNLNLAEVARIWKGGCIIRSVLLDPIQEAYTKDPKLVNLLLDGTFAALANEHLPGLRRTVSEAAAAGIPAPALSSALAYIDSWRTARLPANLIQAQRDYFGAHTYERIDEPGYHHTEWQDIQNVM